MQYVAVVFLELVDVIKNLFHGVGSSPNGGVGSALENGLPITCNCLNCINKHYHTSLAHGSVSSSSRLFGEGDVHGLIVTNNDNESVLSQLQVKPSTEDVP